MNTANGKAFYVGLNAVKAASVPAGMPCITEVATSFLILILPDEPTARQMGSAEAQARWPLSEGWGGHTVVVKVLTKEEAAKILAAFPDLRSDADEEFVFPGEIEGEPIRR